MSGWRRIGVVISVLWLLAVPSYLVISSYGLADGYYKRCIDRASAHSVEEYIKARNDCSADSNSIRILPEQMLETLLLKGDYFEGLIVWAMILIPIALLWIVFGMVRWIARGFTGPKA
jgi:hypothetical protein